MIVEEGNKGRRIDVYLMDKLNISRSKIQKYLKDKDIVVNDKEVKASYLVNAFDVIDINIKAKDTTLTKEKKDIDIVYEDDDLMIINKESGMVVHPAPGHFNHTLVNYLLSNHTLSNMDTLRPGIVHRLDKDTSGLMVVAKNDFTHQALTEMFKEKKVKRTYLAIVEGVINEDRLTIDAPIGRDPNNRQKMKVIAKNSKVAVTHVRVLQRFKNNTLIECSLDTGRTHQIRVHLAYIKHPVVNDPIYSNKHATVFGQMLHSKSISFLHPRTNKKIYFESTVPQEFTKELERLSSI